MRSASRMIEGMMDPSPVEALALLDQVRSFYGLSASGVRVDRDPERCQLNEAYPLLCMMVARLQADSGETERADIQHGWQKALRRRRWDQLPSLDGTGGRSGPPAPTAMSPPRAVLSEPPAVPVPVVGLQAPTLVDAPVGDPLELQIASFLAMFGVAIDPTGLPLGMWPTLPEALARLRLKAERLRAGPLLAPSEYAESWAAIVQSWNEVVGQSALRIPAGRE